MSESKRDVVRSMMIRRSKNAIAQQIAVMSNREHAEVIRQNLNGISTCIGWEIAEEYAFLELADIMEWKRTRVRR